jgi:hypothetical protein
MTIRETMSAHLPRSFFAFSPPPSLLRSLPPARPPSRPPYPPQVLDKIGKYIFVALTDEVLVDGAVEFLGVLLLAEGVDALRLNLLERKHLVSSMMLLLRDGDAYCQDKVCGMFLAALEQPQQRAAADVAAFVNSLEQYVSDPSDGVAKLLEKARLFDDEANTAE